MNKPNKRDSLNLIFSAFLILGYIVCAYFFLNMTATATEIAPYVNTVVFAVFGLVLFYATRVGEGRPVKRFSIGTLIIIVIPALYAILAQLIPELPLHNAIANLGGTTPVDYSPLFILACIALGYGLPYTFFSGFEMAEEEDETVAEAPQETEAQAVYVLCDADTTGALMVVDDLDMAFDPAKEIRLSDVTPAQEDVKIGSYVVCTAAEAITSEEDAAEEAAEEEAAE
ncbi:MAG: hypothetical protein IJV88_01575 [Ruminococcus sp.]|nr:hypothetical protein [Ruminococcus sp.]